MADLYRQNPITGQLELYHADTNTYVEAVAPLQTAAGLNVALINSQQQVLSNFSVLLQAIASNTGSQGVLQELDTIATLLSDGNASITSLTSLINQGLIENGTSIASMTHAIGILMQANNAIATNTGNLLNQLLTTIQNPRPPQLLNQGQAIIQSSVPSSSNLISLGVGQLGLQCYFSAPTAIASIVIELHLIPSPANLADVIFLDVINVTASNLSSNSKYVSKINLLPTYGTVEAIVHLQSISSGAITAFAFQV